MNTETDGSSGALPGQPHWFPALHVGGRLGVWLAIVLAYTAAVSLLVSQLALPGWPEGNEVAAVFGIGFGVLVVLRTNAANDRWWEARKLWGRLVNETRNLALKARAHAAVERPELHQLGTLLVGFAHALRRHLRGEVGVQSVPGFENEDTDFPHAPGYLAGRVFDLLNRWNREGSLCGALTLLILDTHALALMDVCGACERIRNTPLPSSYRALLRWGICLFALCAPWAVALQMGWSSIPVLAVMFGFLLGTEFTAEAIEEPFGQAGDDLPLESYCETIEIFVRAALEMNGQESADPMQAGTHGENRR